MIVPRFRLTQTAETVILEITAKYVDFTALQFIIEGNTLFFYCKPYHLKLRLPGFIQNKLVHSKYESKAGLLSFVMKKAVYGEHFKNLDTVIRLLSPANGMKKIDRVLVIDDAENVQWEEIPETVYKYGFGMKGLYDFHHVIALYPNVLEVDPSKTDLIERINLQRKDEKAKFDVEHYMADFNEDESPIKDLIELKSPWYGTSTISVTFSDMELDILNSFPNKNYNLSKEQRGYCYTTLIDILFAYCYDCRTTAFEGNAESEWTIVKVAASIGWLTGFDSAKCAVISAFRRSLIFPMFRNFSLSKRVFEDVKMILHQGEVCILKCLLHIYYIFLNHSSLHILNNIFFQDYIIYIVKWYSEEWDSVVEQVMDLKIEKKDLNMGLDEVEKDIILRQTTGALFQDEEQGAVALPFNGKVSLNKTEENWDLDWDELHEMQLVTNFSKLSINDKDTTEHEENKKANEYLKQFSF